MSSSTSSATGGVFKRMQPVPPLKSFLDIVLSRTQRKTPTVVHNGYPITRIRAFYMKKVKYTKDTFAEKIDEILQDFPRLEDIHPFYSDLANVLYDRDHYKLALGQLNTAKALIAKVCSDYVKLLKYGDSLFRCKALKKAALGRMATVMRRQKGSLEYLEQVRQHMSRLPSIDPSTRTLLLCGYPNVGKSSFMNCVTKAHVDVQPYAFTTKSLYVGHFDYQLLRWQVIDTPGVLDHPLEERNTIEMQAITALAHVRAIILFFVDVSESCGYTIEQQVSLFESLKPLFQGKPVVIVLNKIDLVRPEEILQSDKDLLQTHFLDCNIPIASSSCVSLEGVMDVRNGACDVLLKERVQQKIAGTKINDILNRLHLAVPKQRDSTVRPAFIPAQVADKLQRKREGALLDVAPEALVTSGGRKLMRDVEQENGGAGVFNVDLKAQYEVKRPEWKYDIIPEIANGRNVADFVDPQVGEKLQRLLAEDSMYDYDESFMDLSPEQLGVLKKHKGIMDVRHMKIMKQRVAKRHCRRPVLVDRMQQRLPTEDSRDKSRLQMRAIERRRQAKTDKSVEGLGGELQKREATELKHLAQRPLNLMAKKGEADRNIQVAKPKWLFSGKRKLGSTRSR